MRSEEQQNRFAEFAVPFLFEKYLYFCIFKIRESDTTKENKTIEKTPAGNERFHASGGVCPQTVLC